MDRFKAGRSKTWYKRLPLMPTAESKARAAAEAAAIVEAVRAVLTQQLAIKRKHHRHAEVDHSASPCSRS